MHLKKQTISCWPEIILCSLMWNTSFFMAHKTQSIFILGLAAMSIVVFAHMIAKIWLFTLQPFKKVLFAGFFWGAACFGVQTFWAANVFTNYYNLYGVQGFVVWFGAFLMYSLVGAVFSFLFILICSGVDAFFISMLELRSKFLRHIFLTLSVLCATPLLFTYLTKISLWPTMTVQGYPFFSPLIPLSSSDKFLNVLEKILGHKKSEWTIAQKFNFYWIEPKAYKLNLSKNRGEPFSATIAAAQILEELENALLKFKQSSNRDTKLLMLAPESSFPFKINEYPEIVKKWASKIAPEHLLILGTYRSEGQKKFQTTCVINNTGIVKFFDKQKLTPFAEKKCTTGENKYPNKAFIDETLTLVPLVCFEFFIDGSSLKRATSANELPIIFANDSWYPQYFKTLLRNQARLSAAWYGKNIVYLSHYSDLCISPFSDSLVTNQVE